MKMPNAKLFQGDFSVGLADELVQNRYDAIIATYSLHHLTDMQKIDFLNMLITLLNDEGCIYIGDVALKLAKIWNCVKCRWATSGMMMRYILFLMN